MSVADVADRFLHINQVCNKTAETIRPSPIKNSLCNNCPSLKNKKAMMMPYNGSRLKLKLEVKAETFFKASNWRMNINTVQAMAKISSHTQSIGVGQK